MITFLVILAFLEASEIQNGSGRVLVFPGDHTKGWISAREIPDRRDDRRVIEFTLGEAKGRVFVPSDLELSYNHKGGKAELGFLAMLPPDAFVRMRLREVTTITDDDMKHIGRMTGLRSLRLPKTYQRQRGSWPQVTAQGF